MLFINFLTIILTTLLVYTFSLIKNKMRTKAFIFSRINQFESAEEYIVLVPYIAL